MVHDDYSRTAVTTVLASPETNFMNPAGVFECFLSTTSEHSNPSLPFEFVNGEDILKANLDASEVDLDFICFADKTHILFPLHTTLQTPSYTVDEQNDERSAIDKMIGNNNVRFLRSCYYEKIYSSFLDGVFVFAELGMYKIGRPLFKAFRRPRMEDSDAEEESCFLFQMDKDQIFSDLNRMIANLPNANIPFEDFKMHVRTLFKNQDVAIFCFGQKQPLNTQAKNIVDIAMAGIQIDIALGREFDIENQFVTSSFSKSLKLFQFSNFLSNISSNTEIANSSKCQEMYPNAYRICGYNTLQHDKKHFNLFLKRAANVSINNSEFFQQYFESAVNNLHQMRRLPEYIERSKFRFEIYFHIEAATQFGMAKGFVKEIPIWMKIVSIPKDTLISYFMGYIQGLKDLAEISRLRDDFGIYFLFIYLYGLFLSGLQSTERMTDSFMEKNFGLSIPSICYDLQLFKFTNEFYRYVSGTKMWNLLLNVFGKNNSNFDERLYFSLRFYWNSPVDLSPEYTKHFEIKIKRFFIVFSERCRANRNRPSEIVTPSKFFTLFKKKYQNNFYASNIITMILKFAERHTEIYSKICEALKDQRIYFYYDSSIYMVRALNDAQVCHELTIESLYKFVQKYKFNEIKAIMDENYIGLQDNLDIRVFLDGMNIFFAAYFKSFITNHNILMTSSGADSDFFLRFIFAKIPVDEHGKDGDELINIVQLFNNIDHFFYVVSHAVIMGFAPSLYNKSMRHRRDNFSVHILPTESGIKWSPAKLIYSTGLFYTIVFGLGSSRICLPIPKKVKLGNLLEIEKRCILLGEYDTTFIQQEVLRENKLAKFTNRAPINISFNTASYSVSNRVPENFQNEDTEDTDELQDENSIAQIRATYMTRRNQAFTHEENETNQSESNENIREMHSQNPSDDNINDETLNVQEQFNQAENDSFDVTDFLENDMHAEEPCEENENEIIFSNTNDESVARPNNEERDDTQIQNSEIQGTSSAPQTTQQPSVIEFYQKLIYVLERNSALRPYKQQILDSLFNPEDFEDKNENSTICQLVDLAGIREESAQKIFKLIQKAVHADLSQEI